MTFAERILKSITNVNDCSLVDATLETDAKGGGAIHLYVKQHRGRDNRCPICGKQCSDMTEQTTMTKLNTAPSVI